MIPEPGVNHWVGFDTGPGNWADLDICLDPLVGFDTLLGLWVSFNIFSAPRQVSATGRFWTSVKDQESVDMLAPVVGQRVIK